MVHEEIQNPRPYKAYAHMLVTTMPAKAWQPIMHCTIKWVNLVDGDDEYNEKETLSHAYNNCMQVGIALKDIDKFEEETECFIIALRYLLSISGSVEYNECIEEFDDTAAGYAFYCAEEADEESYGEMTKKVFSVIEEFRGGNDPD